MHSEDSDQTGQMSRLNGVLAGHTGHFVGFVMCRLICLFNSLVYSGTKKYVHFMFQP